MIEGRFDLSTNVQLSMSTSCSMAKERSTIPAWPGRISTLCPVLRCRSRVLVHLATSSGVRSILSGLSSSGGISKRLHFLGLSASFIHFTRRCSASEHMLMP